MRTTIVIDKVGRLVLPKEMRDAIGICGRSAVEAEVVNGSVLISAPAAAGSLQRRGKRRIYTGKLPDGWNSGEAVGRARAGRLRR